MLQYSAECERPMSHRQLHTVLSRSRVGSYVAGFSLVECLVVVGIVGLLVAIIAPALVRSIAEAKRSSDISSMKQVSLAGMLYRKTTGLFLTPPRNLSMPDWYLKNYANSCLTT